MSSSPPPPYRPDHPDATTALVLGILGLCLCQLLSPFAWITGSRVVGEIDGSRGAWGGRGLANAGRICGMVGTLLMVLGLGLVLLFVVAS